MLAGGFILMTNEELEELEEQIDLLILRVNRLEAFMTDLILKGEPK
jgi:hypothetical protein